MATGNAQYLVVSWTRGQRIPSHVAAQSYSLLPCADKKSAEKHAQGQAATYDVHIFRLESIVRVKPMPVEIEKVSACEDVEG